MVLVFFEIHTTPLGFTSLLAHNQVVHRCIIPCIVLYYIWDLLLPFLVEYSYKGDVNLTHLFCLKDANGSAHNRGACPLLVGMYLLDPF